MSEMTIRIAEIFSSISGEVGLIPQGSPVTFIRTQGCNLCCPYCDTPGTIPLKGGTDMTIPEIAAAVAVFGNSRVIITGGEPGIWREELPILIESLKEREDIVVQIETNGTIDGCVFGNADCVVFDFKEDQSPITFVANVVGFEACGKSMGRGVFVKLPVAWSSYKERIDELVKISALMLKIGQYHITYAISPLAGEGIYQQVFDYVANTHPKVFWKDLVYNFQIHKAMNLA